MGFLRCLKTISSGSEISHIIVTSLGRSLTSRNPLFRDRRVINFEGLKGLIQISAAAAATIQPSISLV
jgi:hypothetical protein